MGKKSWYSSRSEHDAGMEVEDFVEACTECIDRCDEVPEAGEEFAWSIKERLQGMREFAETKERVTAKMVAAMENMSAAIERWLD